MSSDACVFRSILVASHGTPGAQAAERMALSLCAEHAHLLHLVVVPDLWRGMMGDDWLNNASTRAEYGRYVEAQLQREIDEHLARVRLGATARSLHHKSCVVIGEPATCLLEQAAALLPDLIVIGSKRPKGMPGLRSRLRLKQLADNLPAPLLIVPHPQ